MARGPGESDPVREALVGLVDALDIRPPVDADEILAELGVPVVTFTPDDDPTGYRLATGSVLGAFTPSDEGDVVYLLEGLDPYKRADTLFHELGHVVIPWHREVLKMGPTSILPETRQLMENQANEFAFHIRFLGDRFDNEARSMPYSLESGIYLAERYGLSYTRALRRYIDLGDGRYVVLRIFKIDRHWSTLEPRLQLHQFVKPNGRGRYWKFSEDPGAYLAADHPISLAVASGECYANVVQLDSAPIGQVLCSHEIIASERNAFTLSKALQPNRPR